MKNQTTLKTLKDMPEAATVEDMTRVLALHMIETQNRIIDMSLRASTDKREMATVLMELQAQRQLMEKLMRRTMH